MWAGFLYALRIAAWRAFFMPKNWTSSISHFNGPTRRFYILEYKHTTPYIKTLYGAFKTLYR